MSDSTSARAQDHGSGRQVEVQRVDRVTEALLAAVARLVPQLSPRAEPPDAEHLTALVESSTSELYLAVNARGGILGMLALGHYAIPTGRRFCIEDVVVEDRMRGRGIGEALVRAALARARELGARTVELTSRPEREAANRLYARVGFQRRRTNVYTYVFEP